MLENHLYTENDTHYLQILFLNWRFCELDFGTISCFLLLIPGWRPLIYWFVYYLVDFVLYSKISTKYTSVTASSLFMFGILTVIAILYISNCIIIFRLLCRFTQFITLWYCEWQIILKHFYFTSCQEMYLVGTWAINVCFRANFYKQWTCVYLDYI